MADDKALIVLDGVNKWFGPLHVLQDVNLSVGRGEVVVVGEDFGLRVTEIVDAAAAV